MDRVYYAPSNLRKALSILAANENLEMVAGGTDLVVASRSGKRPLPLNLMAINRLEGLRTIRPAANGVLKIGALTTHSDVESSDAIRSAWTALADASALVGSPATRNVGTIGGNVCNASPAMEAGSPLLVFDAIVELKSAKELRRLPFGEFVVGPGRTTRRHDELLTAVLLPKAVKIGRTGSAYVRLEYRQAMEIAVVGAAALLTLGADGRCVAARIALTAVAPTCIRAEAAEVELKGQMPAPELLARSAELAAALARPIDDIRASADYRRAMIIVIVQRALTLAYRRATEKKARTARRGRHGSALTTAGDSA
jgi:CO/xanthine dehydrogenase FAD-binding subunit